MDGQRALLFTAAGPGGTVLVQTRRGALVQGRWPDLVAATEAQLPHGLVLDGELVVRDTEAGRLSFEALQRRAATRARGAAGLVARWPAYLVALDILQSPRTLCPMTVPRRRAPCCSQRSARQRVSVRLLKAVDEARRRRDRLAGELSGFSQIVLFGVAELPDGEYRLPAMAICGPERVPVLGRGP
ncbi:hypothetical protein ACFVT6_38880 [Streptomyces sp. NPDC058049]|uniref:ATP-dependent DNA ligase n=1 Tax=Streptomyces sp. NPDC058049 TaxID=3346314 RepID=UPI0036EBFF3C